MATFVRSIIVSFIVIVSSISFFPSFAVDAPGQLSGTDDLKRQLASPEQVGPLRTNHFVGLFYFVGRGEETLDGNKGPTDVSVVLPANPTAKTDPFHPAWNNSLYNYCYANQHPSYWGKPLFNYYRSKDPWVIRKNLQLITNAGIDFLVFDFSNNEVLVPGIITEVNSIFDAIKALVAQKRNPPFVVFYTNTNSGAYMQQIYDNFYSSDANTSTYFFLPNTSNPLIIGKESEATPVVKRHFTIRESQWPHTPMQPQSMIDWPKKPNGWPWIDWYRPQEVYQNSSGADEIISVSVAQHAEDCIMSTYPFYGIDKNWGRGYSYNTRDHSNAAINRGANIEEQWVYALTKDLPVVFVTGWNEWICMRMLDGEATQYWTPANNVGNFGWQTGGWIGGNISGSGPYIISSTLSGVDINTNKAIKVRIMNGSSATSLKFYWITNNDNNWNEDKSSAPITITPNVAKEYTIDLSGNTNWRDNLTQLRLDPAGGASTGYFNVDYIRIVRNASSTTSVFGWEFDAPMSLLENWTATHSISNFLPQTGGWIGGDITGSDPNITSGDMLGVDISANKTIKIRLINRTSSTNGKFYYTTTTDNVWNEAKSKAFAITPNNVNGTEYSVTMSWTGILKQLRFDPEYNATSGSISIDYIRIFNSSTSTTPVKAWEFNQKQMMVDACNLEFSRDIEMMENGYGDNYYMQLIDFTRKYKGMDDLIPASVQKTIAINTNFSQWDNVSPNFKDFTGDVLDRTMTGFGNINCSNTTGRNDFDSMKVARDLNNVYFYVKTAGNITNRTDTKWMRLFLDVDGDHTNGWKGYDFILNRQSPSSDTKATLERSTGGWNWTSVGQVDYIKSGNQMHVAIPRSFLGNIVEPLDIQFKWWDYKSTSDFDNNVLAFYTTGDAAPDGRLNFNYYSGTLPRLPALGAEIPRSSWTITSLSSIGEYPARYAGNGNNQYWSSYILSENQTEWLKVDMGGTYSIKSVKLLPRYTNRGSEGFPRNFSFEYSTNNSTWTTAPGASFTDYPAPGGGMAPVFNFTSPVTARYIRWVGTKHRFDSYDSYFNTTHGFYMQLDEIYLYKPFEKIDPNKWYKIVSKINSNYCIDISGPLYQCGQIIHLWQYAGTVNQQWKFVDVGNGCYHIESRGNTSFGFDDPYGNLTNGTVLQLCDFNNFDDNQKWQVINTGNGDYKIAPKISVNASSVIDLDNGNTVNDGKLQIWTSWDTNFQLWNIVEVP